LVDQMGGLMPVARVKASIHDRISCRCIPMQQLKSGKKSRVVKMISVGRREGLPFSPGRRMILVLEQVPKGVLNEHHLCTGTQAAGIRRRG